MTRYWILPVSYTEKNQKAASFALSFASSIGRLLSILYLYKNVSIQYMTSNMYHVLWECLDNGKWQVTQGLGLSFKFIIYKHILKCLTNIMSLLPITKYIHVKSSIMCSQSFHFHPPPHNQNFIYWNFPFIFNVQRKVILHCHHCRSFLNDSRKYSFHLGLCPPVCLYWSIHLSEKYNGLAHHSTN